VTTGCFFSYFCLQFSGAPPYLTTAHRTIHIDKKYHFTVHMWPKEVATKGALENRGQMEDYPEVFVYSLVATVDTSEQMDRGS
jgi:hypothetical protein